jgi:hypothetical protein
MAILDGKLVAAIPDTCSDYSPDVDKPTSVKSFKLPVIYECKNFVPKEAGLHGCLFCQNYEKNFHPTKESE